MIDLTIPSYFVAGVVLYYLLLFVLALPHRRPSGTRDELTFVLFVPALNEEAVIGQTLEALLRLNHPRLTICVADDASSDRTWRLLTGYAQNPRVVLLRRTPPHAQLGKSDVLNHCYAHLEALLGSAHPILGGADPAQVIVGIVDADGRLDTDCMEAVAPYFHDHAVASVQVGVRIANSSANVLTRLQDMEFVGFSCFVQRARDHLGSSGLGGNGQFTRLSALRDLHQARGGPWMREALTEDLELGLALVCRGWRTRFCPHTFVSQQGIPQWRSLFRQRTRWIQGHYSCWRYVPRLLLGRRISAVTARFDLIAYLLLIVTVVVVSFDVAAAVASAAGLVDTSSNFGSFVPDGAARNATNLTFGIAPLVCFLFVYQRHATRPFRWWQIPSAGLLFTCYTYVWILATIRALLRLVLRRRNWVKTPRVVEPPGEPDIVVLA